MIFSPLNLERNRRMVGDRYVIAWTKLDLAYLRGDVRLRQSLYWHLSLKVCFVKHCLYFVIKPYSSKCTPWYLTMSLRFIQKNWCRINHGCHAGLTVSYYGEMTTQDVLMRGGGGVTLSSPLGRGDGEWGEVKQNLFFPTEHHNAPVTTHACLSRFELVLG